MTKRELADKLADKLDTLEIAMADLRSVVIEYADHNEPIDLYDLDGGKLERQLDNLGWTNGWVMDRLAHRTDKSRGSLVAKIRKAQGYNV